MCSDGDFTLYVYWRSVLHEDQMTITEKVAEYCLKELYARMNVQYILAKEKIEV